GEHFATARELRGRIKEAFDEAGIEIPFPQRTIWMKTE
ncbi:MAG: mechanosensitive ion channel family protein, partial [Chloroflexi bacterium]|nr:mechanosensitive ion channel family protein [Chloroflexota bacterium]